MIKLKNLLKENSKPKVIKESTRKWAVKVAEVGVVIVDAGNAGEAKRMVAKKMRGGMKDILGVTKALPTRKVGDVAEGGPGSGPQGDYEDNPFDREPSDDELADIEKQFEGKLNERMYTPLEALETSIFDIIIEFKKAFEKSEHKKNRKISMLIKQMLKLEGKLGEEVGELQ